MESNFCRKFILSKFGQIGFSNRIFCILSKIDAKWKFFWYLTFRRTVFLAKFVWSYYPECSWSTRLQDSSKHNIYKENCGIKLMFGLQINIRLSYRLMLLLLVGVARRAQVTGLKYVCNMFAEYKFAICL